MTDLYPKSISFASFPMIPRGAKPSNLLPPDLHSTYSRILDRVDQANGYIRTLV